MIDFVCVSSIILWITLNFSRIKVCRVVGYDPSEGDVEERGRYWNDMDRILDRVGNGYRLCILGNLNGWMGDRMRASITGAFGVPGENDNGRKLVEFSAERELCVANTYFEHRSLHKYTRVARGQDGVDVKSIRDLVLLKKDMLH